MADDLDNQDIPTLITFLFGEKAPLAMQAPAPRLLCWCQAFDDWLDERRRRCQANTYKKALMMWKRFLGKVGKYPWDVSQKDVKGYVAWLQEQGLAPSSIKYELNVISSFYKWCGQHHIDAENGEIVNPTAGAPGPQVRNYGSARVLNLKEARALLAVLRMDEAILTKRDYAFFLARLRLGVAHKKLQQLRWGQIGRDEDGAWVNWGGGGGESGREGGGERGRRSEGERRFAYRRGGGSKTAPLRGGAEGANPRGGSKTTPLPGEVYEAIVDYLRASGRLEGMRAEAYIFAPLANALGQEASGKAEDWDEGRYVGNKQIWRILKRYGRLAGIADEKLTLFALRHTATMLRVEAGDSLEEIQEFLHCPQREVTKNYLKALPPGEAEKEELRDLEKDPPQYPERKANRNKPWGGMTHGMMAKSQPPEEVAAVLAEDIRGMEEEITGLRLLNRSLLEMQKWTTDPEAVALLTDAYTRSATRLGNMIQIEAAMNKRRQEEDWPEQFLARLAEGARERGEVLDIEREKELALGGEGGLAANARRLAEEIAGMRVALRRTFQRAMESEAAQRRIYLTEIYSRGCNRLVKLLSLEGDDQTRLKIYINQVIDDVILAINEEWGLK